MAWWGKLLGGAFGFMLGGPLGAFIGAALGHNFDAGMRGSAGRRAESSPFENRERAQTAFFTATFSVMGHIAKADGRVSEDELRLAASVMEQMGLDGRLRQFAQRLFDTGQSPDFPLGEVIEQFRVECRHSRNLFRMFIEIQLAAAYADGRVHGAERRVLEYISERLGLSASELNHLEAMLRAGTGGAHGPSLEEAYEVLDVNPEAGDDEVKRAYRRLMNRHHPDKLVAKGLPEELMKLATEKTQEVKAAYEQIKAARGS